MMFRLRSSTVDAPAALARARARTLIRYVFSVCIAMLGIWLLGLWLLALRSANQERLEADTGPVLLAMQRIGQLHTITYNMKDVLRQESQTDPQGWVSALPGATEVVHWATHNEALVIVRGSVEAGVDLSRLSAKDVTRVRLPDGTTVLRVHLPPVEVYPPNVSLRVINNHPGPFWRDEQIVPKAQARAAQLFHEAAIQSGIEAQAQDNAIRTLQGMERALGHTHLEFTFQDGR